jgi:hypothetical protein
MNKQLTASGHAFRATYADQRAVSSAIVPPLAKGDVLGYVRTSGLSRKFLEEKNVK